ncbi:putative bifunctional diguanylate cyclase/phosphodiesterase [Planosporangium mesophilum]|nr:EAL domain-containing protein [Planosporangium mesophilum]NJC85940.1 EAL domain-containing protein [Planosporangium mesophilum]
MNGAAAVSGAEVRVARLEAQLAAATAAAQEAYRDTTRLIRLLTVISQPSSSADLVEDTLSTLSDVFAADVVCIGRLVGDKLTIQSSCGLTEGDPAHTEGWSASNTARTALADRRTVAAAYDHSVELPPALATLGVRTAAWVPLATGPDELLILYRRSEELFTSGEQQVLSSVADRLCLALRSRERSAATERLAECGPRLTRHLDLEPLLSEAAELLHQLTCSQRAWIAVVDGDTAELRSRAGLALQEGLGSPEGQSPVPAGWPRPVVELPGWETLVQGQPHHGVDGSHAVLCVPVMRADAPTALLYVARDARRPFLADVVEVCTVFANYLGAALVNAQLYQALARSEASLRLITDSISDMIAVIDADNRFIYASPSYARELGYDPATLIGQPAADMIYLDDLESVRAVRGELAGLSKVEYRVWDGNGSLVWVESALRPAPSEDGSIVVSSRIVDERKWLEEELRQRATHDPLTGLANRALVGEFLDEALSVPDITEVGLLFCDLDKFKAINDRLGHEAGDQLLVQVTDRLSRCLRPTDLLARFGGDEFVFVLDGVNDLTEVTEVGRRVLRALDKPFQLANEWVQMSASVGGVTGTRRQTTASDMLRDADAAMYQAKENGRGLVEVFDVDASTRSRDRLDIRSDLQRALERNQLSVHYQPIWALDSGEIVSFEALVRWHHPERGPIGPDVFIPFAEETGAIVEIGRWVMAQACRQLVSWQQRFPGRPLGINVNVSPAQLRRPEVAADLLAAIRDTGVEPADVWLEVTEHSYVHDDVTQWATALRASGAHFALDDFGTSYCSLAYLKRFPIEGLKIDRSFVSGMVDGSADRSIVRAVLAIAESLDLRVVAEGIETEEQREMLIELGCRTGQGYLMSRPVTADEATALLIPVQGSSHRLTA